MSGVHEDVAAVLNGPPDPDATARDLLDDLDSLGMRFLDVAALWKVHDDMVVLLHKLRRGGAFELMLDLPGAIEPFVDALDAALGGKPYEIGEEVTGARAVACPGGTTLRSVHGSVAALRAEHGWTTTSPRVGDGPAAETVVRANHWTIVDLPDEGEL